MKRKYYVYEWFNIETQEVFYVGKGTGNRKGNLYNRNKFFLDYYNTHRCSNRIVKDNLTQEEAFDYEVKLIKFYKNETNFRLTNQTEGGEGASKFGEENGMHRSRYERPIEWRRKHSEFMKGNTFAKGCKRSEETKKKLRESHKGMVGKKHSEETRSKMSKNSYYKTEEGKAKLKGSGNPNSKNVTFIFKDGTIKTYNTLKEATEIMSSDFIRKLDKTQKPLKTTSKKYKHLNGTKVIMSRKRSTTIESII